MTTKLETTKEKLNVLRWLQKAVSKDDSRAVLRAVNVNDQLESCDGFRLHAARITADELGVPEGLYNIEKLGEVSYLEDNMYASGNYPKVEQIIPGRNNDKIIINVNPKYLAEALSGFDGMVTINIQLNEKSKQSTKLMYITGHSKDDIELYALVMPMHEPEEEARGKWMPHNK